ncbi:heme lyase NrfEFG subunit NrfF, partial [Providencia rustigianii]
MVKFIVSLLLLICTFSVHAQIVDTWQFSSSEEQEISLQIASQLRCPQCQNQNLLESNAPTAVSMRHQVFKMVAEGKTESQIIAYMTERYGNFVLYNPPFSLGTSLLWLLPLLSIITIIFILWRFGLFKKKNNQSETSLILI